MLDDTDRRILRHLLAEPTLSTADLAGRAGVTTATCWRRLEKLTAAGVVQGQQAVIDWRRLGPDHAGRPHPLDPPPQRRRRHARPFGQRRPLLPRFGQPVPQDAAVGIVDLHENTASKRFEE